MGKATEGSEEQDRLLPIANVARIMKRGLPENAKIAKDAKESSDRCVHEKRKTINAEDILWAIQSLGFDSYHDTLNLYLIKYRESLKSDKPKEDDAQAKVNMDLLRAMQQNQQLAARLQGQMDGQGFQLNQNDSQNFNY
ncbi:hypothetical protein HDV04_005667 [Boothiomyces sp. JEL0838]|nr:hypothetical protein HDV04_005667 [Boothiomyces sp. JEL0838]